MGKVVNKSDGKKTFFRHLLVFQTIYPGVHPTVIGLPTSPGVPIVVQYHPLPEAIEHIVSCGAIL